MPKDDLVEKWPFVAAGIKFGLKLFTITPSHLRQKLCEALLSLDDIPLGFLVRNSDKLNAYLKQFVFTEEGDAETFGKAVHGISGDSRLQWKKDKDVPDC